MFLSTLSLAFIALVPGATQASLYSRVVEHPNPNNGYEDYLRAADIVQSGNAGAYLGWSKADYEDRLARKTASVADGSGWSASEEAGLKLAKELHDLDYLGVQRRFVGAFGRALTTVYAGNEKAVWNPREKQDSASLFPEYASFKSVAKLFAADAYVHFADGDSKGATAELLQGYTFACRIGGSNLISELVSIACRSIILAAFDGQLARLSQKDAQQLIAYADAALEQPNSYSKALASERDMSIASIDLLLKNPATLAGGDSPPGGSLDAVAKLSPRDREAARTGLANGISEFYAKLIGRLDEDESTWASAKDNDDLPPMPASVNSVQDLVDVLVRVFLPVHEQATKAVLKARSQLRLLDLHGRVIDFRWKHNRLPAELSDAVPEKLIHDPMGIGPFRYELTADGYRLYSKGLPGTGPIELKYRKQPGLPADDGTIPPSAGKGR